MSNSAVSLNFCFCRLVIMLKAMDSISSGVMRGTSVMGASWPSTRRYGWLPTFRCKSEDLFSTARRSRSSMLNAICVHSASLQLLSERSTQEKEQQGMRDGALLCSYLSRGTGGDGAAANKAGGIIPSPQEEKMALQIGFAEEKRVVEEAGEEAANEGADPVDALV